MVRPRLTVWQFRLTFQIGGGLKVGHILNINVTFLIKYYNESNIGDRFWWSKTGNHLKPFAFNDWPKLHRLDVRFVPVNVLTHVSLSSFITTLFLLDVHIELPFFLLIFLIIPLVTSSLHTPCSVNEHTFGWGCYSFLQVPPTFHDLPLLSITSRTPTPPRSKYPDRLACVCCWSRSKAPNRSAHNIAECDSERSGSAY